MSYLQSRLQRLSHLVSTARKTLLHSLLLLFCEAFIYSSVLLLTVQLIRLGLPGMVAFGLSLFLVLSAGILGLLMRWWGDVQFAEWLGRSLSQNVQDWQEYQDWLHDILADRQRLLQRGQPLFWVMFVTSWRLKRLFLVVLWSRLWR